MNATYITRDKDDFYDVIEEKSKEDVLKRADILLKAEDASSLFELEEVKDPFGILVLFDCITNKDIRMRETPSIGNVKELTALIQKLTSREHFGESDFEVAKQEYRLAKERELKSKEALKQCTKEIHSLETSRKNTETQRDWLQKENQSRSLRLSKCQREIEEYEQALQKECEKDDSRKEEIKIGNRTILKLRALKKSLQEQLEETDAEIAGLRAQITFSSRMLHPQETKAKEESLNRLCGKQKELLNQLKEKEVKCKETEESVLKLKDISNAFNEKKERIEASLNTSRSGLEKAQLDLNKGTRMVDESNSRLEMLRLRIVNLQEKEMEAMEEKEKAFHDLYQKAEYLLKTWVGFSPVVDKCVEMEEVDATTLVNVLFFACGTLCASGETACQYFSNTTVQLDYLMLYRNKEERPGFWNIIEFA